MVVMARLTVCNRHCNRRGPHLSASNRLTALIVIAHLPHTHLRYYTGRLAAYDEDYEKADEHLTYAFQHCHREAKANKRKVLRYLIPVSEA